MNLDASFIYWLFETKHYCCVCMNASNRNWCSSFNQCSCYLSKRVLSNILVTSEPDIGVIFILTLLKYITYIFFILKYIICMKCNMNSIEAIFFNMTELKKYMSSCHVWTVNGNIKKKSDQVHPFSLFSWWLVTSQFCIL
jgi:hypothetical protein